MATQPFLGAATRRPPMTSCPHSPHAPAAKPLSSPSSELRPRGLWVFNAANRLYAGWLKQEPVDEIRHEKDANSPYQLD